MNNIRYKIKISYDGTNYSGWQIQPNKRTVQGEIEALLYKFHGNKTKVRIHSSGRTDTGVHAREQIGHLDLDSSIDKDKLKNSLNSQLDKDIRIHYIQRVKNDFHARFNTINKEYRYFIYNGHIMPATQNLYCFHEKRKLNIGAMKKAANYFLGQHDFSVFSVNPGYNIGNYIRHLYSLDISTHGSKITISIIGNGFLYKMVRSITGFLLDIGAGRFEPEKVKFIFEQKKRTKLVKTLPPQGLFLWKVNY